MKKHLPRFIFIKYPTFSYFRLTPDIWSHIYGIFTLIGFIITAFIVYKTYKGADEPSDQRIIEALSAVISTLVLSFVFASIYYIRRIRKNIELKLINNYLEREVDRMVLILKHLAECNHNIIAYNRNIYTRIEEFLEDKDKKNNSQIIEVLDRFELFLINLTSNLQNYFSISCGDNCAVTIKLLSIDGKLVKTIFRDPASLAKRRSADSCYHNSKGIYRITDNTAFELIMSENYPNAFFAENRLMDLYNHHRYKNSNNDWHKHYNATLVAPISLVTASKERSVLGFIAIDCHKGELATSANIEYLCSIGDLLYTLFASYWEFITFAHQKIQDNDKIERFTAWDYS